MCRIRVGARWQKPSSVIWRKVRLKLFRLGTKPARQINPTVIEVMLEAGIDIRGQRPKLLTPEMLESADCVITMGCSIEATCPASLVPTEDWELEDPQGKPIEKVRQIRDEVKNKIEALLKEFW